MTEHHELVSAHLDGELDDDETSAVTSALASDPDLARHARDLATVRSLVRDLPPVDPPFGALERIMRDLRRYRPARSVVAGTLGAAAAALVLVVGIAPAQQPSEVAPDVDELALRQEVATQPISAVRSADTPYEPVDVDEAGLPDDLGGADATAAYDDGEVTQVVYGEGDDAVSVFVEDGAVDWEELDEVAAEGERDTVAGEPVWRAAVRVAGETLDVVVVEGDGVVLVAVAPQLSAALEAGIARLGGAGEGWDIVDACGGVVETFGFDL